MVWAPIAWKHSLIFLQHTNDMKWEKKKKKMKLWNVQRKWLADIIRIFLHTCLSTFHCSMCAECPEWLTWKNACLFINVTRMMHVRISGNNFRNHVVCSATIRTNNIIIIFIRQHFSVIGAKQWITWCQELLDERWRHPLNQYMP